MECLRIKSTSNSIQLIFKFNRLNNCSGVEKFNGIVKLIQCVFICCCLCRYFCTISSRCHLFGGWLLKSVAYFALLALIYTQPEIFGIKTSKTQCLLPNAMDTHRRFDLCNLFGLSQKCLNVQQLSTVFPLTHFD